MEDYGLNQRQAKYVVNLVKTGNQTQSHIDAGYKGDYDTHRSSASKLLANSNVALAHVSLLRAAQPERTRT